MRSGAADGGAAGARHVESDHLESGGPDLPQRARDRADPAAFAVARVLAQEDS
jgi:hypothetical protein